MQIYTQKYISLIYMGQTVFLYKGKANQQHVDFALSFRAGKRYIYLYIDMFRYMSIHTLPAFFLRKKYFMEK